MGIRRPKLEPKKIKKPLKKLVPGKLFEEMKKIKPEEARKYLKKRWGKDVSVKEFNEMLKEEMEK